MLSLNQHRRTLGLLVLILCWIGASVGEAYSQNQYGADYSSTPSWVANNARIRAEFQLAGDARTGQLLQLVSVGAIGGKSWAPPASESVSPIRLVVDDTTIDNTTRWTLVKSIQEATTRGYLQRITLHPAGLDINVDLNLEASYDQPVLRMWLCIANTGKETHTIRQADFVRWRLQAPPMRALSVQQYMRSQPSFFDQTETDLASSGVAVLSGSHGTHTSWLALRGADGNGIVLGWEFDGRALVTANQADSDSPVEVAGGPMDFNLPVVPGQSVRLPASFVGLFQGDWDDATAVTHRYTEAALAQPIPDQNFPYLMYDSWGFLADIDESKLRTEAVLAASLGVEVFIVDFGWAQKLGDWREDLNRFPGGLDAFAAFVHGLGMKFGLHWVPEEAAPESQVVQSHPEWLSTESDDYFGAASLCVSHLPVQEWTRATLIELVNRYNIDWLTQDGENLVKECTNPNHTHNEKNSNWSNAVQGIDSLVEFSRASLPNLLWENNSDGGNMSTFEAVKRYVTFGSCDACQSLARRQSVYGMSYVFPPRYIDRYMGNEPAIPAKMATRSSMFGGPWILMDRLLDYTPEQLGLLRKETAIYKSLRGLIRDGRVYHLLKPDGVQVDAIESYLASTNQGVIFVYRPDSPDDLATIFPKGLNASAGYRVTFQESNWVFTTTGAKLMSEGIRVPLPSRNFAEIVYINPSGVQ